MYSKQEASKLRQEFWTAFGRYMQPVLSSNGSKVNWINYKTGARHVYFRMEAAKGASIAIELVHSDPALREDFFKRFLQHRDILRDATGEDWIWEAVVPGDNGKTISLIYTRLENVQVLNKKDWPALISFFKPRIIALDNFWNQVKHEFDVWD